VGIGRFSPRRQRSTANPEVIPVREDTRQPITLRGLKMIANGCCRFAQADPGYYVALR
jgi:hypothetical protein